MLGFLPLVGAVVGGLAGTAAWAVSLVAPHVLVVAVAFGLTVGLTGALHIDGFLDSCDAVFASVTPQRRLEILKDPYHGSFAVAFFAVLCAMWLAALWAIDPVRLPLALAFAGSVARWIVVGIASSVALSGSSAAAGSERFRRGLHALMGILALALGWCYWGHAVLLVAVGAITVAAARWMKARLGGRLTGDCFGFLIVCTEVVVLAGLSITSP